MNLKKILLGLLFIASINVMAQKKLNIDEVPKDVRIALESVYAYCTVKNWAFLDETYIADVVIDGQKGKAFFSPSGEWINSKFPVSLSEIPATIGQFYKDNYRSYRVVSCELFEESGAPQIYLMILQPQGIGIGPSFKVTFDTKGNLLTNEGPDPEPEAVKTTKNQSDDEGYSDSRPIKKPKPQKVKPEEIPIVIPPDVVVKAFMKKFPAVKDFTWEEKGTTYNALYEDSQGNAKKAAITKEGKIISVTTEVPDDRIMQMSLKYIDEHYSKYKIVNAEKIEYDRNYVKLVPEQKLQNYSTVTIGFKKNKKYQEVTFMFDKTGKFDSMVNPNNDEYGDE